MMTTNEDSERQPLISRSTSSNSSSKTTTHSRTDRSEDAHPSRLVEDAVLPETSILGRTLSWQSAYILVISRVIGSGIFATPGTIVKSVGSIGLALSVWVVAAIISACGLAISLEYGCMLPRSGGDKVYLEFTYRHPRFLTSTMVTVIAVVLGFTASNCIVFSEYILFALSVENPSSGLRKALAVGLLTIITVIHGAFLKTVIMIQNFLGWVKVGLIIFMVVAGMSVVILPRPPHSTATIPENSLLNWSKIWEGSQWDWAIISTAFFKAFYSYAGLSNVNLVMNEVKDPVRTLRSVTITALVTVCVVYLLINIAYLSVVPVEEIKSSGELIAALFFEKTFGPRFGKVILPIFVALSAAGNVMVVTFTYARLNQEIARQGFLPFSKILSSSYPFDAPLGGLVVHYIPSVLVLTLPSSEVYSFILDVEGYPGQFMALALAIGLILLRHRRSDLNRPFKAWLPAVYLRIAMCLGLISAPLFYRGEEGSNQRLYHAAHAIVGLSVLISALVYWYLWTILVPRWRGYSLEEETDVLSDGTVVTKLIHVKND